MIHEYLNTISGKAKPPALVKQYVADEALQQHIAGAEAAFPHYEMLVEDLIGEGDKVVVRFTLRATHQGDFMGIPATGRQVNVPGIILFWIADEKIVEHWMHFDTMAMMQQLGVQPSQRASCLKHPSTTTGGRMKNTRFSSPNVLSYW